MSLGAQQRLGGWKEIAAHLGRSVRTAQRWETEYALPVRRIHGTTGATVLAYREELDAWRVSPQGRAALSDATVEGAGHAHDTAFAPDSGASPHEFVASARSTDDRTEARDDGNPAQPRSSTRAAHVFASARRLPSSAWVAVGVVVAAIVVMSHSAFRGQTPTLVCPGPCEVTQGETVILSLDADDEGAEYVRWIRSTSGRVESFRPTLTPDTKGRVTWGFTTDCSSQPGRYELRLVHDGSGLQSNSQFVTIHADPLCAGPVADLVAEGVVIERTAAGPGDRVVCHFTLRNQGSLHAPASVTRLRLGRSPDRTAVTDVLLADVPAPALPVGGTVTLTHTVTLPDDVQPGANYYIWIVADNGSAMLERVSTNNFARSAALLVHPRS